MTVVLAACGGGSVGDAVPPAVVVAPAFAPSPIVADISILMLGNSHTSFNRLPDMLVSMVRAGKPGKTAGVAVAPGFLFLDDRLRDPASVALMRSQNWSFVILQAQKYSASGLFTYSTAEAEEWVRMARKASAMPIMFPEWPRRDVPETQRIYDLHVSIAMREPACVAPIGQAWDLALARYPALPLYDADGNHSAPAGAFLTALVLYATVTGNTPLDLPHFAEFPVDADTQGKLKAIASESVLVVPPRRWCPTDVAAQGGAGTNKLARAA